MVARVTRRIQVAFVVVAQALAVTVIVALYLIVLSRGEIFNGHLL
jgi:hypothetical protein